MGLQLANIGKSFDGVEALRDVTLEIGEHEFVCLLGPSGCGKTTLLRIVAGLLQADRGSLSMDGEDLARLPPRSRNFGIVFQSYSLFPNMTVRKSRARSWRHSVGPVGDVGSIVLNFGAI